MAHAQHSLIRDRFGAHCGYCGVTEEEVGGELSVDHFVPTSAGGGEGEENLVYACIRCNLYKGDFYPTQADRTQRHIVLHPLRDSFEMHCRLNHSTGLLEALTETGRFHILLLHLNLPALVSCRLRRRSRELLETTLKILEAENRELRTIIRSQEAYIAHLKNLIGDAPEG